MGLALQLGAMLLLAWATLAGPRPAVAAEPQMGGTPQAHERLAPAGGRTMRAESQAVDAVDLGRRIYREGLGDGGQPVLGVRFGGVEARGSALACVSCHRRSGLGSVEGQDVVPPIAGRFIFQDEEHAVASMNVRTLRQFNQRHAALRSTDFARSVREGRHVSQRELGPMMPRYELSPAELEGLEAYLRTLSSGWSPGVSAQRVQLATIVTPDVSPQRRETFLQTLQAAVRQKNANYLPGMRTMSTAAEMLLRTNRYWDLQVWELEGPADTWAAQLERRYAEHPVFAVLSGVGGGQWAPIHAFCEARELPCWFPSVEAPPVTAGQDFYSLYFSAGVDLEAEVLAGRLQAHPLRRLVQVHLGDAVGVQGASRLAARLEQHAKSRGLPPLDVRTVALPGGQGAAALRAALTRALANLQPDEAVMLWWPEDRLDVLDAVQPPAGPKFLSARMAPLAAERLPSAWRLPGSTVVYPFQPPQKRHATLFHMHAWLKERGLAVRDEVLQSEVFFAVSYFADTLTDMLDNLHRDYLVERAENMLSVREGQKSEDEARELISAKHQKAPGGGGSQGATARLSMTGVRLAEERTPRPLPGRRADVDVKREGTSIYPRLSLAPGQRFASKGAYLLGFTTSGAPETHPEWIVP